MRVVPDRLQHFLASDAAELRAVRATRPFSGSVAQAELDRVLADLGSDLVDHLLGGEGRLRRSRSPVGRAARLVHNDVEAVDRDVLAIVHREDAHAARGNEGTGIRTGLIGERRLERLDLPVGRSADLDADVRARRRTGPEEYVLPRHHNLDGPARFLRQQGRNRFHVDGDLAAEAPSDFHRRHLDLRNRHFEDLGGHVSDDKGALGRAPDVQAAVVIPERGHVMGLDVALMHGRRVECPLDYDVGIRETRLHVAQGPSKMLRNVGHLVGRLSELLCSEIAVQHLGARLHRFRGRHGARQRFVLHLDRVRRLERGMHAVGRHGGHCMALVEGLSLGHDVAVDIGEPGVALADIDQLVLGGREVGSGHDREHAVHRLRLGGIDRENPRVSVGTPHDRSVQCAGKQHVGTVQSTARNLVGAVVAHWARANHVEGLGRENHVGLVAVLARSSVAGSLGCYGSGERGI